MQLDDAQKQQVARWIAEGLKISEIQSRITAEFKLPLTYMEVRLLVDDLKLTPKDGAPPVAPAPVTPAAPAPAAASLKTKPLAGADAELPEMPPAANVSVTVDQIARPGALVSGKVTFSDGQKAEWSLDQMGRLALAAQQKGYRPSQPDVQEFQMALQNELAKMGY
jgi:hypothetical protein